MIVRTGTIKKYKKFSLGITIKHLFNGFAYDLPPIATSSKRFCRMSNICLPFVVCRNSGLLYSMNSPFRIRDNIFGSGCAEPTKQAGIPASVNSETCAPMREISAEITKTMRFVWTAGNYWEQLDDIWEYIFRTNAKRELCESRNPTWKHKDFP